MHFSEQEIPEEELEEDPALISDGRSIAGREELSPTRRSPLPQELDLEHAHPQQLCDAVRDRDLFIAKLVDQYRHLHQTARLSSPVDWQELNQARNCAPDWNNWKRNYRNSYASTKSACRSNEPD
ncbi:MAG: hypothetical protein R3C12_08405 [Planctomycetaceae bacterium]